MSIDLSTNEPQLIYTADEDIHSFQIRDDGIIFVVYQTKIIDIIRPTSKGVYEKLQELKTHTERNYSIHISSIDHNVLYLRAVMKEEEVQVQNVADPNQEESNVAINDEH